MLSQKILLPTSVLISTAFKNMLKPIILVNFLLFLTND